MCTDGMVINEETLFVWKEKLPEQLDQCDHTYKHIWQASFKQQKIKCRWKRTLCLAGDGQLPQQVVR